MLPDATFEMYLSIQAALQSTILNNICSMSPILLTISYTKNPSPTFKKKTCEKSKLKTAWISIDFPYDVYNPHSCGLNVGAINDWRLSVI